jgi:hypothetical protein
MPAPSLPTSAYRLEPCRRQGQLGPLGLLFGGLILGGLLLMILLLGAQAAHADAELLVLPIAMTALGAGLAALYLQQRLARHVIRAITLDIDRPALHIADDVRFCLRFNPRLDAELIEVSAFLECVERAHYRAGNRSRTYYRVTYSDRRRLCGRTRLRDGQEVRLASSFQVPADAMCTFIGVNNTITWRLRVHFRLARWPNINEEFALSLLPITSPPL